LALSLSAPTKTLFVDPDPAAPSNNRYFRYRFVIHRAGIFSRYEDPSDCVDDPSMADGEEDAVAMDVGMEDGNQRSTEAPILYHQLPLRLLANRESYVVNDVLGKTSGPPDIDHNRIEPSRFGGSSGDDRTPSVATMHSRSSSFTKAAVGSGSALSTTSSSATAARKKAVGFAPAPPPYHRAKNLATIQAVHLNSTDGLVVVSAFLPVVLHRSDQGQWTADWDYEVLLSMQTHLRVTRIGVVKWRGWHGNTGSKGSPEAGVPFNERYLVEECLRPFNCVPVWIDTAVFGAM
jgi:trehalose 6-phosphate synthase/phosphatase